MLCVFARISEEIKVFLYFGKYFPWLYASFSPDNLLDTASKKKQKKKMQQEKRSIRILSRAILLVTDVLLAL